MNTVLTWVLLSAVATGEGAWPAFLGQGASGDVRPEAIPLQWSPEKNIAWQVDLPGFGQSSPIVWGGKVFVTSVEGPLKDKCLVAAVNLADGKELWTHAFESSDKVKSSLYVSRAAPTPVTDGRAVYAFFESGDVVAVSLDGKPLWNRSLSAEYGKFQNKFGLAASPVQTEEAVIILVDDEGPSYLTSLSKQDGHTLWKTDRKSRTSWSSPAIVTVKGQPQVVCSSAGSIDGYDPQTGKLLWTFDDVGGNTAATPVPYADGRFLVGASPGREGGERGENAQKSNFAMAIEGGPGEWKPTILWRAESAMPSFGSPIVYAGHAYWVNRSGVVYCFDAATGKRCYTERTSQSCWATPVGVGDRIYFFGKDGTTTVLAAGPKFEKLAENRLWDPAKLKADANVGADEDSEEKRRSAAMFAGPVQYGVAMVGESILIRTGERLYCVRM